MTLPRTFVRSLPQHKLTSYAVCALGLSHAIESDAEEGLFVDARGRILEGTSTNVFAVERDSIVTPPVAAGILPGITRSLVIGAARKSGLRVRERRLTIDDLRRGSFLTGSLTLIAPIRFVDGDSCELAPRDVIHELAAAI